MSVCFSYSQRPPFKPWSSEPIILKCISLKHTTDVMKIRNLSRGLGFLYFQLTCQGGFVSRMQGTDISSICHFVLMLSRLREEEAGDL